MDGEFWFGLRRGLRLGGTARLRRRLAAPGRPLGSAATRADEVLDPDPGAERGGPEDQDEETRPGRAEDRGEEGNHDQAPEETTERLGDPVQPIQIREVDPHGNGFDPAPRCPLSLRG